MFKDIDKAAENLADSRAGWVVRRDGAELLGKIASCALAALKTHEQEPDVDVRRAVDRALGQAGGALAGVAPQAADRTYTVEDLARACEKPGKRTVEPAGQGYVVNVTVRDRHQAVYVMPFKRKDGIELVRIYTFCGPADEKTWLWALRTNEKLAQCAFALIENEGEEQLALMNCYLAGDVTPREVHVAVKEIAHYGDWIESKLTGLDDF